MATSDMPPTEPAPFDVVLTGTGTPYAVPGRAGPGTLVRCGDVHLQFDTGRGTVLRLAEARSGPRRLAAVFLTHHHSDHVIDLDDVVMTRWVARNDVPLPIVTPEGPAARIARGVLDVWQEELELRRSHGRRQALPVPEVVAFETTLDPLVVWGHGAVEVRAVTVHHEPVVPAVAYRVDAAGAAVVISGDTRVCAEVEALAHGADVLVHEACRHEAIAGTPFGFVADYHADTVELGAMASRAGVRTLALTHLIPPPLTADDAAAFAADVREGGFDGEVVVGSDLDVVTVAQGAVTHR